jgi:hypothetical protein
MSWQALKLKLINKILYCCKASLIFLCKRMMTLKRGILIFQFTCLLFINAISQISFEKLNIRLPQLNQAAVKLADYDNDGDLDIAITGEKQNSKIASVNSFYIYRNDGNNEFVEIYQSIISSIGGKVNWGDINNDGLLDVYVTGLEIYTIIPRLYIFKNLGDDKFEQYLDSDTEKGYPNLRNCKTTQIVDINRDGINDICCLDYSTYPFIYINDGSRFIDSLYNRFIEGYVTPVEVNSDWADFNRDGYPDFVFLNNVYANNGDSTFTKIEFSEPLIPDNNYWVDINADGFSDIVSANNIYKNVNGVSFESVGYLPYAGIYSFADFNNDGYMDVISVADYERKTKLMINNQDLSFTIFEIPQLDDNTYAIDLGDLDSDGDIDIVAFGLIHDKGIILLNEGQWVVSNPLQPINLEHTFINGKLCLNWESSDPLGSNLYIKNDNEFIISPGGSKNHRQYHSPTLGNLFLSKSVEIDTSLLIGEGLFEWSVQSINSSYKSSEFAQPAYFTFYKDNALDAPSNLRILNLTRNSASIAWNDNSLSESTYVVESQNQQSFEEILSLPQNSTSFTLNNLTANTQYTIRVKTVNLNKDGLSNIVRFSTPSDINTPTQLQVSSMTKSTITLKWSYIGGNDVGFKIERAQGVSTKYVSIGSSVISEFIDSNVEVGTNYSYRVKAYNESETSKYSGIVYVTFKVHKFEELFLEIQPGETNGMAWGDFDNDGFEDLYIPGAQKLYKNNGNETFTPIENSGIVYSNLYYSVALWGDVDNDGLLDLFIGTEKGKNSLFKNLGNGKFGSISTIISDIPMFTSDAAFVDFDNDGDIDLFVTNRKNPGNGIACYVEDPSYFYRNDGNWEFVSLEIPDLTTQRDNSTMPAFGDLDNNGFTDLVFAKLLTSPADVCPQWHGTEVYYNNNLSGLFVKGEESNHPSKFGASWTALLGDFDNDLDLDLITTDGPSKLYRNKDGKNLEIVNLPSITSSVSGAWVDFDNDADKDIYLNSLDFDTYNHLYQNKNHEFNPVYFGDITYRAQDELAWIDLNNDGFLDLISRDSSKFFNYFRNIPNDNNWLKIRLKGSPSNTFGVGAKVFIKTKYGWQYDYIATSHSYKSQSGYTLNFGLKDCSNIDSVKVVWPMGTKQYLTDINANQMLVIEEKNATELPLYKPSNLKAEILSPKTVEISWTINSIDHTGFIIKRSTSNESNYQIIGEVFGNGNSYVDGTVSNTGQYYYIVQAKKNNETSDESVSLFVELPFPNPTNLAVELINKFERKLTWEHSLIKSNLAKYNIERSIDSSPYTIISDATLKTFIDKEPQTGLLSYRVLGVFDNSFKSEYSNIVEINTLVTALEENLNNISIYPNPAEGIIKIKSNSIIDKIEMNDLLGNQIFLESHGSEIDVSRISSGIYILRLSIGEKIINYKIAITK